MVDTIYKGENINEHTTTPIVQPDSEGEDTMRHLSAGDTLNGLFPFLRAINRKTVHVNKKTIPVNKKTILFIGSASSFFFAGTSEEFFRLRNQIERRLEAYWRKSKAKDGSADDYLPLEKRSVLSIYKRLSNDGIVVILEGGEQGSFWTREEFLRIYGQFLEGNTADFCDIETGDLDSL